MRTSKGLGKGLEAIFSENNLQSNNPETASKLKISDVEPNKNQPRKKIDEATLEELSKSIKENGVIQPILVRKKEDGMYEIIAGERRWRASKKLGMEEIPAVVVDVDEETAAVYALLENLQREDLNPYEEALGYKDLMDRYSYTQEDVARKLGKARSTVTNAIRLLDLPEDIVNYVINGNLTAGHAKALLGLKDKEKMKELAKRISSRNLSVRATESIVKTMNRESVDEEELGEEGRIRVDYIADLQDKVSKLLGRRCIINSQKKEKFVQIEYYDDDDMIKLLTSVCGKNPVDD